MFEIYDQVYALAKSVIYEEIVKVVGLFMNGLQNVVVGI